MKDSTHSALAGVAYTLLHFALPPLPLTASAAALSSAVCGSLVGDLDYDQSTITTLLFTLCPPLRYVFPRAAQFSHTLWFNLPLAALAIYLAAAAGVPRYGAAFALGQTTHLLADLWHGPLPLLPPWPPVSYVPARWRFPAGGAREYRLNHALSALLILLICGYLLTQDAPRAAALLMSAYGLGGPAAPLSYLFQE